MYGGVRIMYGLVSIRYGTLRYATVRYGTLRYATVHYGSLRLRLRVKKLAGTVYKNTKSKRTSINGIPSRLTNNKAVKKLSMDKYIDVKNSYELVKKTTTTREKDYEGY